MKITTRDYIREQMEWMEKLRQADNERNAAENAAMRRAVDKYSETNDERWVGANEFRGQLKDQAGTFLTRRELWFAVFAIIGAVVAILELVIRKV